MAKKEKDVIEKTIVTQVSSIEETPEKKAYILFLSGPLIGKIYNLEAGTTILGRADDAKIVIGDVRISRHHVKIDVDGEKVTIEDIGSTNGTFVNGSKIKTHKLADGDKIQLSSSTIFKFSLQDKTENIFHKELYKMAVIDPATGVHNKRFFLERFKEEFSHARRVQFNLSIIMIDIDHFKNVNDTHGHLAGDMVLQKLASLLKSMIRGEDVFARYGGEEFIVLLRGTNKDGAFQLAERMRLKVAERPLVFEGVDIPITISLGAASLDEDRKHASGEDLIKDADEKLYQSKQNGRNRTTV